MNVEIVGKNIEVTPAIKDYINEKVGSLGKYFKDSSNITAHVLVRTYKQGQKVEVTIPLDKDHTLRQEVVEQDLYTAIDEAESKMAIQIKKYKNKINDRRNKISLGEAFVDEERSADAAADETPSKIEKRKLISENKMMTESEAMLQIELVSHDFFVFEDADSGNPKVLYKRKDGGFGIIEMDDSDE